MQSGICGSFAGLDLVRVLLQRITPSQLRRLESGAMDERRLRSENSRTAAQTVTLKKRCTVRSPTADSAGP